MIEAGVPTHLLPGKRFWKFAFVYEHQKEELELILDGIRGSRIPYAAIKAAVVFVKDRIHDVAHGIRKIYVPEDETEFFFPDWLLIYSVKSVCDQYLASSISDKVSGTVMTQIINIMTGRKLKSLAGLDNTQVDAKDAATRLMDSLHILIPDDSDLKAACQFAMHQLRDGLKQHLEDNISAMGNSCDRCIFHCLEYAFAKDKV
jgi:hypothetical protein